MVSAYGDMQNIRTAMNRGAFDFVTKPIDFEDLETTIQKTIEELVRLREGLKARHELLAIRRELDVARQIQESILPRDFGPKGPERRLLGLCRDARGERGRRRLLRLLHDRRGSARRAARGRVRQGGPGRHLHVAQPHAPARDGAAGARPRRVPAPRQPNAVHRRGLGPVRHRGLHHRQHANRRRGLQHGRALLAIGRPGQRERRHPAGRRRDGPRG